jgi:hypothetical protein
MLYAPVTSVATKVMPSRAAAPLVAAVLVPVRLVGTARPEPAGAPDTDPPAADDDALELEPAAGGVLELAHAATPAISAMAAMPAATILLVRMVVLTCVHVLTPPRLRLLARPVVASSGAGHPLCRIR